MTDGEIGKQYGLGEESGLCDYLIGNIRKEEITKSSGIENLEVITHGEIPPNPAELLALPEFKQLIEWCSNRYDLVIIDTPEAIVADDASVIGTLADTVLLVARYGKTLMQDVYLAQQKFEQAEIKVSGVVFNGSESK